MQKDSIMLPIDPQGQAVQLEPANKALASTVKSSIAASTAVSIHVDAVIIQIKALVDTVFFSFGAAPVTAQDDGFDGCLLAGETQHVVVPDGYNTVNFIDGGVGGTVIIIQK